ncbi:MAG: hypothetical protein WDN45_06060 [Caulobacteraceae bacterium]
MPKTTLTRLALIGGFSAVLAMNGAASAAFAQSSDPAAAKIDSFDSAVIKTCRPARPRAPPAAPR